MGERHRALTRVPVLTAWNVLRGRRFCCPHRGRGFLVCVGVREGSERGEARAAPARVGAPPVVDGCQVELDGRRDARDECLEVEFGNGRDAAELAGDGDAREVRHGERETDPSPREGSDDLGCSGRAEDQGFEARRGGLVGER